MSKSILVIDTPECCDYCPVGRIFGMDGQVECMAGKNIRVNSNGRTIPDWCPLRELPAEREVVFDDRSIWAERRRGYNACIEEIFGKNIYQ